MNRTGHPDHVLQGSYQPLRESAGGSGPLVEVEVAEPPPAAALEAEWRDLEARSDCSFFLTWDWIGPWLATLPADVKRRLVRVRIAGRTTGLAIFCEGERRRGPMTTRTLHLHATGRAELDELMIEYNGILADRVVETEVVRATLRHLLDDPDWEEVSLDGWHRADLAAHLDAPGVRLVVEQTRPNRFVDLAALRGQQRPFIDTLLSAGTRNHIRRTLRFCEASGGAGFRVARTVEEALAFFADMKRLNLAAWKSRGVRSAFDNPFFCAFHEAAIRAGTESGVVQVARLEAGGRPVGYVHGFVHRGRFLAYQTGFDFEYGGFSVWSPGLATHACAVEHFRERGLRIYDLMAGESRYKKDLAPQSASMDWLVLQRPVLKLQVYGGMRAAWNQVQGWTRRDAPAAS